MNFKTALKISGGLHLTLLVLMFLGLIGGGQGNGESKDQGNKQGFKNEDNKDILPKSVEVEIVETPPKDKDGLSEPKPPEKPKFATHNCEGNEESWFGGIGVLISYDMQKGIIILDAFQGYPAYNAGIRRRDIILRYSDNDIKGEPGTPLTLTVQKADSGDVVQIELIRDKICTKK